MKRTFLALAAFAALFALATSGFAQTLTTNIDLDTNYSAGDLADGSNGNSDAFGAWSIATTSGSEGWVGIGIWGLENTLFNTNTFSESGNAFGLIGKGEGFSVKATRAFRKALAVGESFSLMMAVDYDCGDDSTSLKGFVLLAGSEEVVKVNHDAFPGAISVNGETGDLASLTNYGTTPMTWTFTQTDEATLHVVGTPRDSTQENFETDITCAAGTIDGFRLQSANQVNENEDRRQTYFNNFTLVQDLSDVEVVQLALAEDNGAYLVDAASKDFAFTVSIPEARESDLTVSLASSDSAFLAPSADSVTIAAGATSATFTATATLTGNNQSATLTVTATGCDQATWGIQGPNFGINGWNGVDNTNAVLQGETTSGYVNEYAFAVDADSASKIAIASSDESVLTAASQENWAMGDTGLYGQYSVEGVAGGSADVVVSFDGVEMCRWPFTVNALGITLSGASKVAVGASATVTVGATGLNGTTLLVTSDNDACVSVDTGDADNYLYPNTDDWTGTFTVTGVAEGSATITVADEDGNYTETLSVTVKAAFDPTAPTCIAYDEASYYADGFDLTAVGVGSDKFQAWTENQATAEFGGVYIADSTAANLHTDILENEKAFGLYANGGDDPNYKLLRPFVNDIAAGQTASVDFVQNTGSGSRFVQFVRIWEGTPYSRFEVWTSGTSIGVNLEGSDSITLDDWALADGETRTVTASMTLAEDGSEYTIALESSDGLTWSTTQSTSAENWGDGIQGVLIGAWNTGMDFYFNRLYIYDPNGGGEGTETTVSVASATYDASAKALSVTLTADVDVSGTTATVYVTDNLTSGEWTAVEGATVTASGSSIAIGGIPYESEGPLFIRLGNN